MMIVSKFLIPLVCSFFVWGRGAGMFWVWVFLDVVVLTLFGVF